MAKPPTGVRSRNIFDPGSAKPYKLSRSKLESFLECPRCFYLDRRLGIKRPEGPPFTLNNACDELLKREFDHHRLLRTPHPCAVSAGLDAFPYLHDNLSKWRHNFTGVEFHHPACNLIVHGAIDDIWINGAEELIVVDYKATSSKEQITESYVYRDSYRRQLEIYQWLFRQNGFRVANTAYLVYVNARKDRERFENRLEFDLTLIPCTGSTEWVEARIIAAWECLCHAAPPPPTENCQWCLYRDASRAAESLFM